MMARKPKFVAYFRVSDEKTQGRSGLGIAGQKDDVGNFVRGRGGEIIASFTEIESGKNNDRAELAKAILRCRKTGACLLVAKLDRLSRDAGFLMSLRSSGVELAAANMPEANTIMFMVMAGMAQQEREYISERTKTALKAAKDRGTKLGGFRENAPDIRAYYKQGVLANRAKAQDTAEFLRDDIEPLARTALSLRAIAAALNDAGILTPRSKSLYDAGNLTPENKKAWSAQGVANVIERLGIDRAA
jgi:DNA invertase Pin-like site-specific DNA recombinase